MPPILQLDLQQIVSQAISFLLLWWVLKRFAWRPILGALDARRAHIEADLRAAEQAKADMARLQQELTQRLAAIDDEARAKLQETIREGKRVAIEIQEEARAQAHAVLAKSQETIAMELAKAKVTLRDELADLTVQAVEQLLKNKLDLKADHKLVGSILDELGREPSSGRVF